ncbi:MAG: 2-oxoacid:acceptor oxidoreductase family protein [Firmicutes bacterium]|nr:2-oxoacid:acceptor oxidoreductase family protein [Candidatus Fermentithermobacillaceae bacterium]
MGKIIEIRWHARGGQGAKTASTLLAETCHAAGKYVQGFPEYGPERMGAPMRAFNRVGDDPITIHAPVEHPDFVLVLDPTLLGSIDVSEGLRPGGTVLINTTLSPEEARKRLPLKEGKIATVDASGISLATIGRDIPNTPMMGALMRLSGIIPFDLFLETIRKDLLKKFHGRTNVVEGNLKAIKRAYEEVKSE